MTQSRWIRNVFSSYVLSVVTGVIGFLLTPMLYHHLRAEKYGIYIFTFSLLVILEALELGMTSALIRYISSMAAQQQYEEVGKLTGAVFHLLLLTGAAGSIVVIVLRKPLADFFQVSQLPATGGEWVIALTGLSLLFHLPSFCLLGYLQGLQEFQKSNTVDALVQMVRALLIVVFIWKGWGLLPLVALIPAMALLRFAGLLVAARRATIPYLPQLGQLNLISLRQIRSFATLSFFSDNFYRWFMQLDRLLAARLLPLPELALIGIARRIPGAMRDFTAQPFWVTYPRVSSAEAQDDRSWIKKFVILSSRNLLALTLPLGLTLWVWAETILRFWIGEEIVPAVPIFRLFILFATFSALQEVPLTLLYGVGKIRYNTALWAMLLVAGLVAGAAGASFYGLIGLAISYTTVQGIGTVILFHHALPIAEVRRSELFRRAIAPVLYAVVPAAIWILATGWLLPQNMVSATASVVPGLLIFLGLFARMIAGPEKMNWQTRAKRIFLGLD